MLTAIAGHRWVIGRGMRLAVMKCGKSLEVRPAFADVVSAGIAKCLSEGLRHGLEHGQAQLSLESIEAYDPEAEAKFVMALQALKDLKYPLVDQLEGLKDAPMDVIMTALYLESDTGDDPPQYIRDLRPSSSQLTIPVYPKPHRRNLKTILREFVIFIVPPVCLVCSMGVFTHTQHLRHNIKDTDAVCGHSDFCRNNYFGSIGYGKRRITVARFDHCSAPVRPFYQSVRLRVLDRCEPLCDI
uniref:Transposase (Putative), gypsy type n=1 Tax=Tanacetum cinerariifolium TaxID=118510 RepID=A0A699KGD7_TANCI|nr:transposase (putative), gypsy type [Tanacetum cinerariifolium]